MHNLFLFCLYCGERRLQDPCFFKFTHAIHQNNNIDISITYCEFFLLQITIQGCCGLLFNFSTRKTKTEMKRKAKNHSVFYSMYHPPRKNDAVKQINGWRIILLITYIHANKNVSFWVVPTSPLDYEQRMLKNFLSVLF